VDTARRAAHLIGDAFPEKERVRLYVWEWPVRITHWVLVLSIVVLTVTGVYLYAPFLTSKASHHFVTATMRFVHEVTGFVFIAAFIVRMYWFFAGNRWARWPQFVPLGRRRWDLFKAQLAYYMFLRRNPPFSIGHNPLAGVTYIVVFFIMFVEVLTGLALFQHVNPNKTLGYFIDWLPQIISFRYLRLIHFGIMFALWAFFIHHVYSAILIGLEERSGLVSSIFTGSKFFSGRKLNEEARREREGA
jgi:Ni/Fe-hydrogenase 1 B-type cytochrome subunit